MTALRKKQRLREMGEPTTEYIDKKVAFYYCKNRHYII